MKKTLEPIRKIPLDVAGLHGRCAALRCIAVALLRLLRAPCSAAVRFQLGPQDLFFGWVLGIFLLMALLGASSTYAQDAAGVVHDASWGLRFTPPEGWMRHQAPEGYLFVSPTQQGILAVLPHEAQSVEALRAEAEQGLADDAGTQLQLQGPLEPFGDAGLAGDFGGWIEGSPAKARVIGLVSPHGRGATILMAAAPQHYTDEYPALAKAVAQSVVFTPPPATASTTAAQADSPEAREWAEWFDGCRLSYFNRYNSGYGGGGYSDETTVDLCPGYFTYSGRSETVFNTSDLSGSDVYSSSGKKGAGQWQVAMQAGQPVLNLRFHDGTVQTFVLSYEDGKTYLDGRRWLRTCNPNDQVVEARPQCW